MVRGGKYRKYQQGSYVHHPLVPMMPTGIDNSIHNINTIGQDQTPNNVSANIYQPRPQNQLSPWASILPVANAGLLALSNSYNQNRQNDYRNSNMNNPYMGMLAYNDGRSDEVTYGYKTYQEGGSSDPFKELYDKLYSDLENTPDQEAEKVEPPTTEDMDGVQQEIMAQQNAQLKKQYGRSIVEDFGKMFNQDDETQEPANYQDEGENEGAPISQDRFTPQSGSLVDMFKNGIANVETGGAKNPYGIGNKNSSAAGKYQFLAGTRNAVRKMFYPNMSQTQFESNYRQPQFQEEVMTNYSNYLLQKHKDPYTAATAYFLGEGKANKVNDPSYRPTPNNATVGQYLNKFHKGFTR